MKKAARHLGELLVVLATIAVGTAALIAWRLASGPVDAGWARDDIAAALTRLRDGQPAEVDEVSLVWSSADRALVLKASAVRLLDRERRPVAVVRDVIVQLDGAAVALGRIAVNRAALVGGEVSVTVLPDNSAEIAFGPPGTPADLRLPAVPPATDLVQMVDRVLSAAWVGVDRLREGRALERFEVRDATLNVLRVAAPGIQAAPALRVPGVTAALSAGQSDPHLSVGVRRGEGQARVRVDLKPDRASAELAVALDDFPLGDLPDIVPAVTLPAMAGAVDLDAGIDVRTGQGLDLRRLDLAAGNLGFPNSVGLREVKRVAVRGRSTNPGGPFILDRIQLDATRYTVLGRGSLADASGLFRPAKPIALQADLEALAFPVGRGPIVELTDVSGQGDFTLATRTLRLERYSARIENQTAGGTMSMVIAPNGDIERLVLRTAMERSMSRQQALAAWPEAIAPNTRAWAERALRTATVRNLTLGLHLSGDEIRSERPDDDSVDLRLDFTGVDLAPGGRMPVIADSAGSLRLTGRTLSVRVPSARLMGVQVRNSAFTIPDVRAPRPEMVVNAAASGGARSMLELLGAMMPDVIAAQPFDPAATSGSGSFQLSFRRPLDDENAPMTAASYSGRVTGVSAVSRDRRLSIRSPGLEVSGDLARIRFAGPATMGETSGDVVWDQQLVRAPQQGQAQFSFDGTFSPRELDTFGVPTRAWLRGPVPAQVEGVWSGTRLQSARLQADLASAQLRAPLDFWTKAAGAPASLTAALERSPDGGIVLRDLNFAGAGLTLAGTLALTPDGRLALLEAERARLEGRLDAAVRGRSTPEGLELSVSGRALDFGVPPLELAGLGAGRTERGAAVSLQVDVERMGFGPTLALSDARLSVNTRAGGVPTIALRGRAPGGPVSLDVGARDAGGRQALEARFGDTGAFAEALGLGGQLSGGRAAISGHVSLVEGAPRFTGAVAARDFRLERAPALAQILSLGSLRGLADTLSGGGLFFTRLDGPVTFADGRVGLPDLRATGPAMGVTARGSVNVTERTIDLDGVLAPAYGVNSFLGNLPLLGNVLVSRPGEGVVGVTWSLRGPYTATRVGVNPLSALAPGILRRLFEPSDTEARTVQATPPPPATQPTPTLAPAAQPSP